MSCAVGGAVIAVEAVIVKGMACVVRGTAARVIGRQVDRVRAVADVVDVLRRQRTGAAAGVGRDDHAVGAGDRDTPVVGARSLDREHRAHVADVQRAAKRDGIPIVAGDREAHSRVGRGRGDGHGGDGGCRREQSRAAPAIGRQACLPLPRVHAPVGTRHSCASCPCRNRLAQGGEHESRLAIQGMSVVCRRNVGSWLAAGAVAVATLLSVCAGAEAKHFRVYTCTVRDQQKGLGPTIGYSNLPSGWELGWSSLVVATIDDRCTLGDRFTFQAAGPRCPEARASGLAGRRSLALSLSGSQLLGWRCRASTPRVVKAQGNSRSRPTSRRCSRRPAHSRPGSGSWACRRSNPRLRPRDGSSCALPASTNVRPTRSRRSKRRCSRPSSTSTTPHHRSAASQALRRTPRPGPGTCVSA